MTPRYRLPTLLILLAPEVNPLWTKTHTGRLRPPRSTQHPS